MRKIIGIFAFNLLVVWAGNTCAQTTGGQLLQQNRELVPTLPLVQTPERESAPAAIKPLTRKPGQLEFVIKRIELAGNTLIDSKDLQATVEDLLNKATTFDELQQITDAVVELYRDRGWLVRAVLPEQDITEGSLKVIVIEARLGQVRISQQDGQRASAQRIQSWIAQQVPGQEALSLSKLDRALLNLNDLPDIHLTSSLQQGADEGKTDLLLDVSDAPRINGQVMTDNFDGGSDLSRLSGLIFVNGLHGLGEQLSLYGLYTKANSYAQASYTVPVGTDGWRLSANASFMSYRVLTPAFSSLEIHGVTQTAGLLASYPVLRTRATNITGTAGWNFNRLKNWNIHGANADQTYNTSNFQFGLTASNMDNWGGGGINAGSLTLTAGHIDHDPAGSYNTNYSVAGAFTKLRYSANRTQAITNDLSLYLSVSGQMTSKNMDSSEQMYLGGASNVRAYASGQGAASQGTLLSAELRQNLPHQVQISAFYDLGLVETWKFNNHTVNNVSNTYTLQGVGASLAWTGPHGLAVKATWAHRVGPLPQSVVDSFNQNGGLDSDRFWLNATIQF